jgi:hypothetical protein
MIAWQVTVDGDDFVVSVERGANEKDFIRVNGRLAAAPMTADEVECGVNLGGAAYVIRRDGDSFQLFPDEDTSNRSDPPAARRPWLRYLVRAGFAGLVIVNLLAAVAIFDEYRAQDRVRKLLHELQVEQESGMLHAMGLWRGKPFRLDEMSSVSKDFDHWRVESNLYGRRFRSYRITRASLAWTGMVPTVVVTFALDKAECRVLVPRGGQISMDGPPPQLAEVIPAPPKPREPRIPGPPTKLTFEVLPPPPPDPNAPPKVTTAKPGSMVTFLPRGHAMGRVFVMRPGEYLIVIHALNRSSGDGNNVTYISAEAVPLLPGFTGGYVTIDGGTQSLSTRTYGPKKDRDDGAKIRFTLSLDGMSCTASGGTLQILALDYDMGDSNSTTGARQVYLKRLDAKYSVECDGTKAVTIGEIHLVGETN